jgi:hypothetical protein
MFWISMFILLATLLVVFAYVLLNIDKQILIAWCGTDLLNETFSGNNNETFSNE